MEKYNAILVFGLMIFSSSLMAQTKTDTVSVAYLQEKSPSSASVQIYIDGTIISKEAFDFVQPEDIESFSIIKDTIPYKAVAKLKKGLSQSFKSMQDISNKYIKQKLQNPLFFVNDKLVLDSNFLLAENNLKSVFVSASAHIPYHSDQEFDIIKIYTKSPAQHFIRGTAGAR